jgi:hypothetical protein
LYPKMSDVLICAALGKIDWRVRQEGEQILTMTINRDLFFYAVNSLLII